MEENGWQNYWILKSEGDNAISSIYYNTTCRTEIQHRATWKPQGLRQ
jgi:hypothetical protein